MTKVIVLYSNQENSNFDLKYYTESHIPLVKKLLGESCKKVEVESGVAGATPGSSPAFLVIGHLYFDSVADFQNALAPHAEKILGDIPKFTNVNPIIQISEILL